MTKTVSEISKRKASRTSPVLSEISGACGDLGLFLSLALALHLACGLSFVASLAWAGLANIITGFAFGIPLPVQPMKAIAALAIAGGLSVAEISAAGLLTGVVLLCLTLSNSFDRLYRWMPEVLIRSLQLGLGIKLAWVALQWMLPAFDVLVKNTAVLPVEWLVLCTVVAALLAGLFLRRLPLGLLFFAVGLLFAAHAISNPYLMAIELDRVAMDTPDPMSSLPWLPMTAEGWWQAVSLAIAQLPLTVLNSVLAVVLLARELFPKAGQSVVSPSRLGWSLSGFNVFGGMLGLMPLCHGSGGLAAQYHFGARTAWSVIGLGVVKIIVAVAMGASALTLVAEFPEPILGVMVLFAAAELARHGLRVERAELPLLTLTAIAIAVLGALPGLAIGLAAWFLQRRLRAS